MATGKPQQDQPSNLGVFVHTQRTRRLWTQQQVATRAKCSVSTVSKIESGARKPDLILARALDTALETGDTIVTMVRCRTSSTSATRHVPALTQPDPDLVGHEAAMDQIQQHMTRRGMPIAVLNGLPGLGKTAVALRWAHANSKTYRDGVLYAQLDGHHPSRPPVTAEDVLADLLADLGVTEIPTGMRARAQLLHSATHDKRCLFVLDDAASSEQVAPLLPSGPGNAVVVTSRRRLSGLALHHSARRVPLEPLDADPAAHLLSQLTTAPTTPAEVDALERIATLGCGGLPLAVRAAAEVIADHPGHSLTELAEPLTSRRHLHVLNTATQGALLDAFHGSYSRLGPLAARLFRILGLDDYAMLTADQAAARLDVSTDSAERVVAALLDEHLLIPTRSGAYCPRLLRSYASTLPSVPIGATSAPQDATELSAPELQPMQPN